MALGETFLTLYLLDLFQKSFSGNAKNNNNNKIFLQILEIHILSILIYELKLLAQSKLSNSRNI